ncbi:Siroheme synthase [Morus notabilis]|uniref:uroporphyrinogen-III C-methyltransferase n=1 Tax=Morus notabilis TaxID=981085 RepID=W9R9J7_9ROSA|nr:Siroheme synthase [Morus notabilis]
MALVHKLQFQSPATPHFGTRTHFNPKPISSLHLHSSSPFTEKHSIERYQRDQWIYQNQQQQQQPISSPDFDSARENDIALQLPELKKLLGVLREKRRERGGCGEGDGEGCWPGNVFLVGTGPGDPELLTMKAVRVIKGADLLLYDRLVSNDVLDLVGGDAKLLYVGKTAGYHSRTQEEIHELLLSFAEAGATVVRLKGGDPLVFGRGGEEMDFLQQQGIQVKVIPGITAASGIAAELGIPLTQRGMANSVRFLTGHSRKGGTDPLFVAENAADPDTTLVVYMGLSTLPSLALKLMHHGLPSNTPAVAVERGTTPQQRMAFAELKDLAGEIASVELVSPTLIIIGKVVALSPFWPHPVKEASSCLTEVNSSKVYTDSFREQRSDQDFAAPVKFCTGEEFIFSAPDRELDVSFACKQPERASPFGMRLTTNY